MATNEGTTGWATTHPAKILIVDDEARNRRLLEVLLQPEGYLTTCAANGKEALAELANQSVDLILLDGMMPEMNGYELATILKSDALTKSIPIIMVTARVDRQTRLAALDAGVEEFLPKPVDRAELWLRVRNLLRLKEYADLLADQSTVLEQRVAERTADLQRFRMAMDATADAIFLIDRKTMTFVEVNATASLMLGYGRDELLKLGPLALHALPSGELELAFDDVIAGEAGGTAVRAEMRRKDGSHFPGEMHRHARLSDDGWMIIGVLTDITDRTAAEDSLHRLAHYDTLTGLPNRKLFYETLDKTLRTAARNDWRVAVMFIDVDHFKNVNDTLGHHLGDDLLAQIATRLVDCVRLRDTVGRLGGDEFALVLTMDSNELGAAAAAAKIREALRKPFDLAGNAVTATASIGITMYPADAANPASLVTYADTAMYGAKQAGRDTFRFFQPQMNADVIERLELQQALRNALDNDEFVLHYQPKAQISNGRIIGVEALLRWQRPGHGLVPPGQFIAVLEETSLIREVGDWVIRQACRQLATWADTDIGPMRIAVNVSGRQFLDTDLAADIAAALLTHGVPADALELELTESILMANTERTIAELRKLKTKGVKVSIDDFGTGYSCLAYLARFPIDTLKIDIAFIRNVTSNAADAAMTETIIQMAHSLKMDVIAEGVETAAQLAYLVSKGCDQIQGYYFSRPLPANELERLLRTDARLCMPQTDNGARQTTVLIIDDNPVTLTALERLLEQDGYRLLTALSAAKGFDLLAMHHVQVIVCDGRIAFADGSAQLRTMKALHPHTPRIVLSDGTDSQLVVDAVNKGAIYGLHHTPSDNNALRRHVREAAHDYIRNEEMRCDLAGAAHEDGNPPGVSRNK